MFVEIVFELKRQPEIFPVELAESDALFVQGLNDGDFPQQRHAGFAEAFFALALGSGVRFDCLADEHLARVLWVSGGGGAWKSLYRVMDLLHNQILRRNRSPALWARRVVRYPFVNAFVVEDVAAAQGCLDGDGVHADGAVARRDLADVGSEGGDAGCGVIGFERLSGEVLGVSGKSFACERMKQLRVLVIQ